VREASIKRNKEVEQMDTTTYAEMPVLERLEPVHTPGLQRVFGILRLLLGFTFLWAFLDKTFALGFGTGRLDDGTIKFFGDAAWIHGASPTVGVIGFALKGPFTDTIQSVTGYQMTQTGPTVDAWVDWLFMASLLLIGLGLFTGVMTRLAAFGGIAWLAVFYLATSIWPENNPFLDEHVIYAVVLVGLVLANAGRYWGLGKIWQRVGWVENRRWLY
jgi:thiosulfate dehydrogenase (quinone) large subunit